MSVQLVVASYGVEVDPNALDENGHPKPARRLEVTAKDTIETVQTPNGPANGRRCQSKNIYGYGNRQSELVINLREDGIQRHYRGLNRPFGPKVPVYVVDHPGHDNHLDLVFADGSLVEKTFQGTDAAGDPL